MGRVLGSFWERFGRDLEALGQFFDVIFDEVTTHLKLRFSSIEKKRSQERIWKGLERFGKDFGELWGEVGSLSGRHLGSIWCIPVGAFLEVRVEEFLPHGLSDTERQIRTLSSSCCLNWPFKLEISSIDIDVLWN